MRKRLLSLLLTAAMLITLLAGCSKTSGDKPGQDNTPNQAAGTQAPAKSDSGSTADNNAGNTADNAAGFPKSDVYKGETNQQTYPLSSEKITLTYWYPNAGSLGALGDYNESEFFQWLEEKTNIHIEFIVPAAGEESQSFNNLFISGEMPDIMYTQPKYHNYRDGMDAAIDDGYIADIREHLDWAPNYVSWVNSIETAKKDVFTDSGKMYGFWSFWDNIEGGYADQGLSIRKDFLDKVHMEVPTTYDEWETVLTAFKDQLGIEAPFYTSKNGIDHGEFMAGFGIAPRFYQVDGKVKFGPMEDAYKEYLTLLNSWYKKGLLDPDFATRKSTGVAADNDMMLNDKVGSLIDWGTRMTDAYISRGATNPEFWTVAAPQPKKNASDPDPAWREVNNNYRDIQAVCLCVNANSKHLEEAIRWVDSFYAKDVYLNANYGIDSEKDRVWYEAEDGHRIGIYDFRYSNPDGLDSATVAAKYWAKNPPIRCEASQIEQMPPERAASYAVWSKYEPKNYIPVTVTMTSDENSEYTQYYTDIEAYVQENEVKFINGERSLDEYDAYRDTLKSMGIEKCISLQQSSLDRYNNR
jgi:putative aldouronate transport system substrate-binding protein